MWSALPVNTPSGKRLLQKERKTLYSNSSTLHLLKCLVMGDVLSPERPLGNAASQESRCDGSVQYVIA